MESASHWHMLWKPYAINSPANRYCFLCNTKTHTEAKGGLVCVWEAGGRILPSWIYTVPCLQWSCLLCESEEEEQEEQEEEEEKPPKRSIRSTRFYAQPGIVFMLQPSTFRASGPYSVRFSEANIPTGPWNDSVFDIFFCSSCLFASCIC